MVVSLARAERLAAMLAVYRGLPRPLAEQPVDSVIVVEVQLDAAALPPPAGWTAES